jgi:starch phosphorylase
LHTRLIREQIFRDFDDFYPGKITNETNGVTPRRWLLKCNPKLSALITSRIGAGWETDLERLSGLVRYAQDPDFQQEWRAVKRANKERLAAYLRKHHGLELDPSHLVDAHIKRIHEYKRQLLNIMHVISLYLKLRNEPAVEVTPRTFIFSGKAAPGYQMAKRMVHLINAVADVISADARVRRVLRVLFVPNYGVTTAEHIIPATDVSEQISTAGTEASGTGNMKFALNGALTVGTLDGANVEILEAVGEENMFIFGLTAEDVEAYRRSGRQPRELYYAEPELRSVIDAISAGMFSPDDPSRFRAIVDTLLNGDSYLVLADFLSYASCQRSVEAAYRDQASWTRRAILNVAHMGRFSSDATIVGYARDIWGI